MSNYGKFMPYRRRYQPALQRRNAMAGPSAFSDLNTGLELRGQNDQQNPNEQPSDDANSPKLILKNSLLRLVDSIVPQIEAEVRILFRLVWVLIYLGLFGTFMFTFYELVDKYRKRPTTFDLTVETGENLDFPAVTVCNENSIRTYYDTMYYGTRNFSDLIQLDNFVYYLPFYYLSYDEAGKLPPDFSCPEDNFPCEDKLYCIPHQWLCDSVVHCKDGSDEKLDAVGCIEANRWRIEGNDDSYFCVPPYIECPRVDDPTQTHCAKICNDIVECADAIDETNPNFTCSKTFNYEEILPAASTIRTVKSPISRFGTPIKEFWSRIIKSNDASFIRVTVDFYHSQSSCQYSSLPAVLMFNHVKSQQEATDILQSTGPLQQDEILLCVGEKNDGNQVNQQFDFNSSVVTIFISNIVSVPNVTLKLTYQAIPFPDDQPASVSGDSLKVPSFLNTTDFNKRSEQLEFVTSANCSTDVYCSLMKFDSLFNPNSAWARYQTEENLTTLDIKNNFLNVRSDYFSLYNSSSVDDFTDFRQSIMLNYEGSLWKWGAGFVRDFIVQCTFRNRNCNLREEFFPSIDSTYGLCYTFKPNRSREDRSVAETVSVKLTLFTDSVQYIGSIAHNAGVRVAIHEPDAFETLDSQSLAASVGEATFINVKAQRKERLSGEYSNCVNEFPASLGLTKTFREEKKYTQKGCFRLCLAREVAKKCKCKEPVDYNYFADQEITLIRDFCAPMNAAHKECRDDVYRRFQEKKLTCPCETPCNVTEYNWVTSRSRWPSQAYCSHFAAKILESSFWTVYYSFKIIKDPDVYHIWNYVGQNFVRVEITFQSSTFDKISEEPAYTFSDLISDFGGNISLWLGWSIFALFEVLIFILRCAEALFVTIKTANMLNR